MDYTSFPTPTLPQRDYYVLDVSDLVAILRYEWHRIFNAMQDKSGVSAPDVSAIVTHVFDSIKQEENANEALAMAAYVDMLSFRYGVGQYGDDHIKLANLTVQFGNQLVQRIKSFGIYCAGYFPYHFAGWMGDSVLVALDGTHAPDERWEDGRFVTKVDDEIGDLNAMPVSEEALRELEEMWITKSKPPGVVDFESICIT